MLREQLEIACDHVSPERNIELVQQLVREYEHHIVPLDSDVDLFRYTCVVHAFRFTESDEYMQIATMPGHNVFAGKDFVKWLLQTDSLNELTSTNAPIGSLVMYFDDEGGFTHIGLLLEGNRIESKWGQLGLFTHDLFEVPLNYGNVVRYFSGLP